MVTGFTRSLRECAFLDVFILKQRAPAERSYYFRQGALPLLTLQRKTGNMANYSLQEANNGWREKNNQSGIGQDG